MSKGFTLSSATCCGLAPTMVLAATIGLAGGPTVIRVHEVCSPPGGGDRVIVRSPARALPDGPPGLWSPGITLVPHEAGITVLVESVAVTGDAPTPDDNDFTRVDLGVQSVAVLGDGTEVRLVGVFDWTEPAAAASWAAADFAVIAPPGVDDVRILAAQLGDATIEGPWELPDPTIEHEGFLHLFGGTFRGWSIENLVIRGFDWAIGMYYDSLGDFDGVSVRNNLIELPEDLPGSFSTPSGEPFQNIGIHLAFGNRSGQRSQSDRSSVARTGIGPRLRPLAPLAPAVRLLAVPSTHSRGRRSDPTSWRRIGSLARASRTPHPTTG